MVMSLIRPHSALHFSVGFLLAIVFLFLSSLKMKSHGFDIDSLWCPADWSQLSPIKDMMILLYDPKHQSLTTAINK